jgi:predicted metal-dependent hydrolase
MSPILKHIIYGSHLIEFSLSFTQRKTIGIKVHPHGYVQVIAPVDTPEELVFEKVRTKSVWILKQLKEFRAYRPKTPPRQYINGETHLYLGRQYRLKSIQSTEKALKLFRGYIYLQNPVTSPEALKIQLDKWYKQKAQAIFEEMLLSLLEKFQRFNIQSPEIVVRTMSKRWGSCTPAGKIILNTELIKAPKGSIEYVIIHELCHLVHHNHTKSFYDLQTTLLPDWQKWKNRLEYCLA